MKPLINSEKFSEFWAPIRNNPGLFIGKPVRMCNGFISRTTRYIEVCLHVNQHESYVAIWFKGSDRFERRDKAVSLFPKTKYQYTLQESKEYAKVMFPVLNKGKEDRECWPELRENLTKLGTDVYNKILNSDV